MKKKVRLAIGVVILFAGALFGNIALGAVVSALNVSQAGNALNVHLEGNGLKHFNSFPLNNPRRLVLDIVEANIDISYKVQEVNNVELSKIELKEYEGEKGKVARVIFYLGEQTEYKINLKENGLDVELFSPFGENPGPRALASNTPTSTSAESPKGNNPPKEESLEELASSAGFTSSDKQSTGTTASPNKEETKPPVEQPQAEEKAVAKTEQKEEAPTEQPQAMASSAPIEEPIPPPPSAMPVEKEEDKPANTGVLLAQAPKNNTNTASDESDDSAFAPTPPPQKNDVALTPQGGGLEEEKAPEKESVEELTETPPPPPAPKSTNDKAPNQAQKNKAEPLPPISGNSDVEEINSPSPPPPPPPPPPPSSQSQMAEKPVPKLAPTVRKSAPPPPPPPSAEPEEEVVEEVVEQPSTPPPLPPPTGKTDMAREVYEGMKSLQKVGFKVFVDRTRVYVQLDHPSDYNVVETGTDSITLTLPKARIMSRANKLPIDARWFPTAIAKIVPRSDYDQVRIEISLKQKVPFRADAEGNLVYVDFALPTNGDELVPNWEPKKGIVDGKPIVSDQQ